MVKQSEDIFEKATQAVFTLVENLLNKHKQNSCDMNDLFYFGCVLTGLLVSRLDGVEQINFKSNLQEILNDAANDGIVMCKEIMSANLTTEEERLQAMNKLISSLKGKGSADSSILSSIADDLNSLAIKEDSLWKPISNMYYESNVEEEIQGSIEDFINKVIASIPKSSDLADPKPELMFLITAVINTGLMAGYLSILYRKPLEEYISLGINKINALMSIESNILH